MGRERGGLGRVFGWFFGEGFRGVLRVFHGMSVSFFGGCLSMFLCISLVLVGFSSFPRGFDVIPTFFATVDFRVCNRSPQGHSNFSNRPLRASWRVGWGLGIGREGRGRGGG